MDNIDEDRTSHDRDDSDSWDQVDYEETIEDVELLELSESQLREEYDNEEIERFLALFASDVNEVQMPTPPKNDAPILGRNGDNGQNPYNSYSEELALRYIRPYLPPTPAQVPPFTFGRLRIATQRLYLSTIPVYVPFLRRLLKLATWEVKETSAFYCSIYWILWYYNMLLPALLFRILYCLVRRRVLPYPSAAELKARQIEVDEAKQIGDEFTARLASGSLSGFDAQDMWRLFKAVTRSSKSRAKKQEKDKAKRKDKGKEKEKDDDDAATTESSEPATVSPDAKDEKDLARFGLQCMNAIADVHERVHNIFIWRRPQASFRYGILISTCFLLVLLCPAQYISKLVYLIIGVLFWHVAPIVASLPSEDRARLPPPLADIPTDADYAMELIAQRINAGMPVRPSRKLNRRQRARARVTKPEDDVPTPSPLLTPEIGGSSRPEKKINWAKWGGRAARGKAWALDNRLAGGKKEWPQESNTPRTPLVPPPATALGQSQASVESHTYPCQHSSAPGLITISPAMFYFAPIMSQHPTLSFPISYLKGVKKSGILNGLTLKWSDPEDGDKERDETFLWVGGRDELFARLIGANHHKWIRT